MGEPPTEGKCAQWKEALSPKGKPNRTPWVDRTSKAGKGPNEASGRKEGISRQGSKRG